MGWGDGQLGADYDDYSINILMGELKGHPKYWLCLNKPSVFQLGKKWSRHNKSLSQSKSFLTKGENTI